MPKNIQQSFHGVDDCLTAMSAGYHKQFLRLVTVSRSSNEVDDTIGLACLHIDHTCTTERRAYLRHLTTRDLAEYEESLKLVLKHT